MASSDLQCPAMPAGRADRVTASATAANVARNARADIGRRRRWAPARDALWASVAHLVADARVAVVGAGNADDLPLGRLARVAGRVVLLDVDAHAAAAARRRLPRTERRRVGVLEHDVTLGVADRIVCAAAAGDAPPVWAVAPVPLPDGPHDLVIGDLFYSQLVYPGLVDAGVPGEVADAIGADVGPRLTAAVVARLHASAPAVLHVHDPLAWWPGHAQPVTLDAVLALAGRDPEAAVRLAATGRGPQGWDPRAALERLGLPILDTTLWRWPFAPGVDYLACATLSGPR
jgi:hypothetical protein